MNTVLHTHWESRYDAVPKTKDMINRLVEIKAKAVAITDHGSLAAFEDAYDQIKHDEVDLKLIYGMEAYVEYMPLFQSFLSKYTAEKELKAEGKSAHLIMMAKDKIGKWAIDKMNYDANYQIAERDGTPVVSLDSLQKWIGKGSKAHGHVILTSACISGPMGAILQNNEFRQKEIDKLERKLKKGIETGAIVSDDNDDLTKLIKRKEDLEANIKEYSEKKSELNKIAKKPTLGLEKRIARYKEVGKESGELEQQVMEIKMAAEKAQKEISELTIKSEAAKRLLSEINEKLKSLQVAANKFTILTNEIAEIEKKKTSDEVLYACAKEMAEWLKSVAGDDCFFAEIQYHKWNKEKEIYDNIIKIAKELNIPLVAANDAHMAGNTEHDLNARLVARYLRFTTLDDAEQIEHEKEMYLKGHDELKETLLLAYPEDVVNEAMKNADLIGDLCEGYERDAASHYPVYDKNIDAGKKLVQEAYAGIEWRFPNKKGWTEEYQKRLEYELGIINQMGYADYHLIVKEMLEYARLLGKVPNDRISEAPLNIEQLKAWVKENDWTVGVGIGPGRGSAVGSLVCYLIGITNIDPIKYGLVFERFLNPERVSMPDIDSDYKTDIRDKTIEFIKAKYGEKAVCNIMTKGYQQMRGAIRDAARFYGAVKNENFLALGDRIRKAVPNGLNLTFDTNMQKVKKENADETIFDHLVDLFKEDENAVEILKIAKDVEGSFTNYGMHAAGLIISDNADLSDYVPLKFNTSDKEKSLWCWTTQCDMVQGEALGLLKMDLLNLKTLNVITDALRMIKKNHGIAIDPYEIPFEKEVFKEIFAKGNTIGVFQFESPGMRAYLKRLKPENIEDVIILNAMYRPGPMDFIPGVCDVKNGKCLPHYETPELEPILGDTYGAIVYQEQVMEICKQLAGYSMGQADNIRRAMSKKKQYVIDAERSSFVYGDSERNIKGCVNNGITEDAANRIYDSMIDFAKYAFNKSHSAAYSVIAYITAWLKYHYTTEFICALLMHTDKITDYAKFIQNAREMGVEVLPPDANRSEVNFSVQNGKLYFGLKSVKAVGKSIAEVIEVRKNHPFENFNDFAERTKVGSRALNNLILAGAFDSLGYSRNSLMGAAFMDIMDTASEMAKKEELNNNIDKVIDLLKEENFGTVENLKERLKEKGISYSVTTKKIPTIANLEAKADKAKKDADDARKHLRQIQIPYIKPDIIQDLNNEMEVLGMYLSGHPIDQYCVHTKPILDAEEGKASITGIIENVNVMYNRYKNPWASITVSDKSGSMKVNVWAKTYADCADLLKVGNGIIIDGRIEVDEFQTNSQEGDETEDIVYCMSANKIRKAKKNEKIYRINLQNEAIFFFEFKDILKKYEVEEGARIQFYFEDNAIFRTLSYCIPEEVAAQIGEIVE